MSGLIDRDALARCLIVVPVGCELGTNLVGNLTVTRDGEYIGYIDFRLAKFFTVTTITVEGEPTLVTEGFDV